VLSCQQVIGSLGGTGLGVWRTEQERRTLPARCLLTLLLSLAQWVSQPSISCIRMRFVDLFAGLGGFHLALSELGHECVFACEKEARLRAVYRENFGIEPQADIRSIDPEQIPKHEILCAGFPCQPFSKAGEQEGFACPNNGDLFGHVLRIIRHHRPKYLLLENVANLQQHDDGKTWKSMKRRLALAGYSVKAERLSPHRFGIPQIRERLFIVGERGQLRGFVWPAAPAKTTTTIESVLEKTPRDAKGLSKRVTSCLETWQRFLEAIPEDVELPSWPLWTMEFGATYPFQDGTPWSRRKALGRYSGAFGIPLKGLKWEEAVELLPSHARQKRRKFPEWKVRFIRQNRAFFEANKQWITPWLPAIRKFPSSLQKLEWNMRGERGEIWQYVIQFRASGVRVKRRTTAPSLIAMTTTQVPIIAWERRYMTPNECARLQSMDRLKVLPSGEVHVYAALGNAVNVKIVRLVAEALIGPSVARKRAKAA
jgi:DNA (cytosine-5)-methyltransferase 1